MKRCASVILPAALLALSLSACSRSDGLKGQTNTALTFYGKAVDQDGMPLAGARFEYRVEAYPKDWTFETRGQPNDKSTISAVSDENGRFTFTVSGCTMRRMAAECVGYHHFCDDDRHGDAVNNYFFTLIAWGDLWYKTDAAHPAVYVFVKDGVKEVSALPSRGGWDSGGGKQWTLNEPAWPKQPSLKDIVFKSAATQAGPR